MLQALLSNVSVFTALLQQPNEAFYFVLGSLAVWRILIVARMHFNRPRKLPIIGGSYALGRCLFNFDFIFDAPKLIFNAYEELGKISFAIPGLAEYQVLACSELDAKAVCESSEGALSFHAAMVDRLKHKYTMFGFEHNDVDPFNVVPARTLKVLLRMHLPELRPIIKARIVEGFDSQILNGRPMPRGWTSLSAFTLCKSATERVNSQIFLGTELANTPDFMASAIRYSHDAIVAAEICRQLPSIFTPLVAPIVMRWSGAMKRVARSIRRVVENRLHESSSQGHSMNKHLDCIQWIIESSQTKPQRKVERLVQQIGAVYFASSHQMPMALVYAIYSLCTHPEYIEALRSEANQVLRSDTKEPFKCMHLLDAFLRESARLNPLDALSIQRKVLVPFKLPSGATIPKGNLIAVPQHAALRNEEIYPRPEHFDPYRYYPKQTCSRSKDVTTKYTDVNAAYPYWGSPKKPCPGRWYVSETLKIALVHLYMNYEFKLEDDGDSRSFFWTTAIIPRMTTRILLKPREGQVG